MGGLPSEERPGQGDAGPEGPVHEGPGHVDPDFLVPFDVLGRGVPWWDEAPAPADVALERWWATEVLDAPPRPRRRGFGVRALGVVTAAALVLATIGAGIGEMLGLGATPSASVRAAVTSVRPATGATSHPASSSTAGTEVVDVTVYPPAGRSPADCLVEVVRDGRVLGSQLVTVTHWAAGRSVARGEVKVPLDQAPFSGSARNARIDCST
ncbi:MAG: hypothetical protein ACYCU7_00590 [Acidimicrobiales bacterium]